MTRISYLDQLEKRWNERKSGARASSPALGREVRDLNREI
jgi:hypothetical protein